MKKQQSKKKKQLGRKRRSQKSIEKKSKKKYKKRKKNLQRIKTYLKELIFAIILSVIVIVSISSLFLTSVSVHGFSMIPVLREKDQVLVQKTNELKRFDLVAFRVGNGNTQIRRIIGLSEEKIVYTDDTLFVNDQVKDEKFITDEINESQYNGKNFTEDFTSRRLTSSSVIPDGYYLVLGDNRPYATDSRHYGLISKKNVIGKVTLKFLPFGDLKVM